MLPYQTLATFPSLFYLHALLLYQFFSPYQTFIVLSNICHFSPFVIYSLFTLYTHPINAPAVHTTHTQLLLPSYRAHVLCAITGPQRNRRLWPSCHSDVGGSRHRWGFSLRTLCLKIDLVSHLAHSGGIREIQTGLFNFGMATSLKEGKL